MISIIGAGKVGSASAFNILRFRISDVVLIDIAEDLARGEALDMMQAAPAIEFDGKVKGTSSFSEMEGSEVVVVVAGAGRKPGMTRFDLMTVNSKIVKSVVKEVVRYAPQCKLMVVTNPVDIMTYIAYKESGFERNRVFGMGNILDTMRFSTKTSGADVIKLKGSTTYAPAVVIAIVVDAVLRGRNRVMSISTFLKGEYGFSDISIGVPVILGKNGVERILELELSSEAEKQFMRSASIIEHMINRLRNASKKHQE